MLQAILALLDQRQGDVCVADMAESLHLSLGRARVVFREISGVSFRHAQTRARLGMARSLVRESSKPISEIACLVGYGRRAKFDQSYFSVFAITPAADRASVSQKSPEKNLKELQNRSLRGSTSGLSKQ